MKWCVELLNCVDCISLIDAVTSHVVLCVSIEPPYFLFSLISNYKKRKKGIRYIIIF